jgi:plasmid stabilization system protein ParE
MRHEFHPEAFQEYVEVVRHYENCRTGLGERFIQCIEDAIDSVCQAPERWPILDKDIHRRLTRVFPYAVLYSIEQDFVLIVAIMHCHQKPGYWFSRTR